MELCSTNQNTTREPIIRRWLLSVTIVCAGWGIGYFLLLLYSHHKHNQLPNQGVNLIENISECSGLPLFPLTQDQWVIRSACVHRHKSSDLDNMELALCPRCGQDDTGGNAVFRVLDMELAPILRFAGCSVDRKIVGQIKLSDIRTDLKLAALKERLIYQCVEII